MNRATGSTPFFLNHSDHPRTHVNVNVVTPLPAANSLVGRVSAAVSSAGESLLNAQQRMSRNADQARRDEQLSVGEYVLLSSTEVVQCGQETAAEQVFGTRKDPAKEGCCGL